jgi:hypothetical protein
MRVRAPALPFPEQLVSLYPLAFREVFRADWGEIEANWALSTAPAIEEVLDAD